MLRALCCCLVAAAASGAYAEIPNADESLSQDLDEQYYIEAEGELLPEMQDAENAGADLIETAQWGGPPRRTWTCWVRNTQGRTFSGQGRSRETARRLAMDRCAARSNSCRLSSCR